MEDCRKLASFERKILKRIFEPVKKEDGFFRSRYNEKLETLTNGETTIGFIKSHKD